MYRVIVIGVAGLSLAGCASFSLDTFKSAPPPVTVQFDSVPPGAEARLPSGASCKTPCSLPVPPENFSVTFSLPRFEPQTIPVQVILLPGDFTTPPTTTIDPNPVVAELQPAVPAKKGRAAPRAAKKKRPAAPKTAAPPPPDSSPFPNPPAR